MPTKLDMPVKFNKPPTLDAPVTLYEMQSSRILYYGIIIDKQKGSRTEPGAIYAGASFLIHIPDIQFVLTTPDILADLEHLPLDIGAIIKSALGDERIKTIQTELDKIKGWSLEQLLDAGYKPMPMKDIKDPRKTTPNKKPGKSILEPIG